MTYYNYQIEQFILNSPHNENEGDAFKEIAETISDNEIQKYQVARKLKEHWESREDLIRKGNEKDIAVWRIEIFSDTNDTQDVIISSDSSVILSTLG